MLREEIAETLNVFFNKIDCAKDGVDALEQYKQYIKKENNFYDIIITDLNMPNMDGMELIKKIKEIHPEQIIIVLSASNESKKIIELIDYGIDSFILKPMDHKRFMSTLYKISKLIVNEKKEKEEIKNNFLLTEYSKLSTINWLIDSISYQWKQPLTVIKTDSSCIELKVESKIPLTDDELLFSTKNINIQVDHLDQMMHQIKNIFNVSTNKEYIDIYTEIVKIYMLIKNDLSAKNILFDININKPVNIFIITTDFKYVIINLIKFYVDNIISWQTTNEKKILFDVTQTESKVVIKVKNNIKIQKEQERNAELTLQMCKVLIEKNEGEITFHNTQKESYFKIELPK